MTEPSQIKPLQTAVRDGEVHTVRKLLDSNAFDEYMEQNGGQLLFRCPSIDMADLLIQKGASVDAVCEDGMTLLNKAALRGDAYTMYILVCYGATTYNRCPDGKKFFKRLSANSLLNPLLSSKYEDKEREVLEKLSEAKYKTLRLLFENQKPLLTRLLLAPAPVHRRRDRNGKDIVGTNINWNVTNDVKYIWDTLTGQNIDLTPELFPKVVKVHCPNVKDQLDFEWCIPVCGTTRDVFMSIYAVYKHLSKRRDKNLVFKGLREIKEGAEYREYYLDLGSSKA